MKMKLLWMGLVSGLTLAACGGPATGEAPGTADELTATQGELCGGWDAGARRCTWKCTSSAARWSSVGVGVVAHGQCQDFANSQCGRTAYATCWSQ